MTKSYRKKGIQVFLLPTVKLPKMSEEEMDRMLHEQFLCRIAFRGQENPYIAPFQYVVVEDKMYFHFTDYGRKMRLVNEGNPVCVEIERYLPDLSKYGFVVLFGNLKQVTDQDERKKAIEAMAESGRERLSKKFLAAHGFSEDKDWSDFTPDKPIKILRLEVTGKMGLKSP